MRQVLFVVVLIGASFAGGAVVNGPGLHWAQAQVMSRLGIADSGGSDVPPTVPSISNSNTNTTSADSIPSRPIPPLVIDVPAAQPERTKPAETPAAPVDPSSITFEPAPSALPGLAPVPETTPTPPPIDPPAPLVTSRDREREAIDLAVATAGAKDKPQEAEKTKDVHVRLASTPGTAVAAEPADWAEVRRALRDLGVSRYGVDGDPNGQARFHCVIPLAGRKAVGQHFEAEGDDDLQAARAVLRRINLWRATEVGSNTP